MINEKPVTKTFDTLCLNAGKVNEELRLGVSGSTSLDDVGWFICYRHS